MAAALRNIILLWNVVAVVPMAVPLAPAAQMVNLKTCLSYKNYFRFKHETDCQYFYECHAGLTYLLKCPDHSWFDSSIQTCTLNKSNACNEPAVIPGEVIRIIKDGSDNMEEDDTSDSSYTGYVNSLKNRQSSRNNKGVTVIYKYIYVTESSKRINTNNRNRRNKLIENIESTSETLTTSTDSTLDSETETESTEKESTEIESVESKEKESKENESPEKESWEMTSTEKAKKKKNKRKHGSTIENFEEAHKIFARSTSRVKRNTKYVMDGDEDDYDLKNNYRSQMIRFARRLNIPPYFVRDNNVTEWYRTTTDQPESTESTLYNFIIHSSETLVDEITRPAIKKITTKTGKKHKNKVRFIDFGSYPQHKVQYKIKGRYFQLYESGNDTYQLKLFAKRPNVSKDFPISHIDKTTERLHKIKKRSDIEHGIHITLHLKDKQKKTKILTNHFYTNCPYYETSTEKPESYNILKLFKPNLDLGQYNLITRLNNAHNVFTELDLLKLHERNKINREFYNKANFIQNDVEKRSRTDYTDNEQLNSISHDHFSGRQYIVIHYKHKKISPRSFIKPTIRETELYPLTTDYIITSTPNTRLKNLLTERYEYSLQYGPNYDSAKEPTTSHTAH